MVAMTHLGRNSHVSTITLSGKTLEGTETSGNRTTMCPLQGYLLGSAIELPETKKEHRTSLGELFQRTKMTEENSVAKCESGEKKADKETNKSAIRLMKKILKKRMVHDSSRTSTTVTGGNVISASMETKLHKILHMFHKKVYPENSTSAWKSDKPHKNEPKNNITCEEGYYDGDYMHPDSSDKDSDNLAELYSNSDTSSYGEPEQKGCSNRCCNRNNLNTESNYLKTIVEMNGLSTGPSINVLTDEQKFVLNLIDQIKDQELKLKMLEAYQKT
ncbi:protein LAZY 1-like [Camellia sinensis]|uniref:protein LAZY 1-like n=1 Tax=Camellia sinensis TaxID=4442 RepID=UPI0010355B1A|nr:protein LAZY 1-like [Camellia sinensis]